jgi:excisionase family DNA binding protein
MYPEIEDMTKDNPARTVSVPEAGRQLGVGRDAAYRAAALGQLPTIRIGRRLLVPRAALERLLAGGSQPALASAE